MLPYSFNLNPVIDVRPPDRGACSLTFGKNQPAPQPIQMNPDMTVNEVVNCYLDARKNSSVAEAASQTLKKLSILPSVLVDAFSAAQLDLSRSEEEAKVMHAHRNELLSHFNKIV